MNSSWHSFARSFRKVILIVITDGTNNTGYYTGAYSFFAAYWVKDHVFYTLRVIGDSADQAKNRATLDRILAEI